jgi:hypothetical protein
MTSSTCGQQIVLEDGTILEGIKYPSTPEELRLYLTGVRGLKAFHRDLAQLLKEYPRQWVAYHGAQRIGIARTQLELYQECVRRGIPTEEFVIRWIEPEMPELVVDPFGLDRGPDLQGCGGPVGQCNSPGRTEATPTPPFSTRYVLEDGTIIEGVKRPSTPEELRVYLIGVRGLKTFHKELAQLLKEYPRQWVAYHGAQRIGIAPTDIELYQQCLRRGIPEGEFVIRWIEPEMPELVVDPFGLDKE